MFQIDEKVIKDSRTLITIQGKKENIEHLTKNGTINYTTADNNLWLTTPKIRTAYIQRNDIAELYDKIVIARYGTDIDASYNFLEAITFSDNVEMKKDLVIRGNLTVEGKSTIIDTPSLTIEDNIIELNKNEIGNGISLKKAGTAINRGQKPFARYLFSDTDKAFILDTNSKIDADTNSDSWIIKAYAENNGEYESGELRARHRFTAPFAKITDSLTVANQSTFNHLITNGTVNFRGNAITSNLTTNGSFISNNTSEFNGLLTANKVSTFNDNVITNAMLNAKGKSNFDDLSTFNKGIKIVSDGANVTGDVNITGALTASENTSLLKDLSVGAMTTTNNLKVNETSTTKDLVVDRDANIKRDLTVEGSIDANSYSMFNDGLEVHEDLLVTCESNFNNNVNVKDSLNVKGQLNIKSDALFEKDLTLKGNMVIEGTTAIEGALEVNADITVDNADIKNNMRFQDGNGKGISFWNDENHKIYMSTSTDGNYGGRLDSTSDYNMYFRIANGTNRGFIFKNGSTPLLQIESTGQVRIKDDVLIKGFAALTRANEGHKTDSSGINADKLDNLHSTDFLIRNTNTDTSGKIVFTTNGKALEFNQNAALYYNNDGVIVKTSLDTLNNFKVIANDNSNLLDVNSSSLNYKNHIVWHKGNHGPNSGLNADMIDGKHATDFSLVNHSHDDRYIKNDEVNLKGKYRIEYDEEFDCLDFMYIGDMI